MNKKKLSSVLVNILLLILVTGVCFAVGEIAVRIWKSNDLAPGLWPEENAKFIPELRKNLYPNITNITRSTNEFTYHVSTNAQGFRDFHPLAKKNGTKRIVIVGASTLFGNTVEINQTYSALLGENLEVETIDLGLGANGFPEIDFILKEYGMQYQPDLILIEAELGTFYATYDYSRRAETPPKKSLFIWTYEHSKLINYVYWKIKTTPLGYKIINTLGINEKAQDGNAFDLALLQHQQDAAVNTSITDSYQYLKEIKNIANQKHIPIAVIFIPTSYQLNPEKQEAIREQYHLSAENFDPEVAENMIHALTKKLQIPLFDPTPSLQKAKNAQSLNWPLDGHFTIEGHQLYAQLLAKYITEKKLLNKYQENTGSAAQP